MHACTVLAETSLGVETETESEGARRLRPLQAPVPHLNGTAAGARKVRAVQVVALPTPRMPPCTALTTEARRSRWNSANQDESITWCESDGRDS